MKLLNFGRKRQLLFVFLFLWLPVKICFLFSFMCNLAFLLKENFSISFKESKMTIKNIMTYFRVWLCEQVNNIVPDKILGNQKTELPSSLIKGCLGDNIQLRMWRTLKGGLSFLMKCLGIAHNILLNFSDYIVKTKISLCLASGNLWSTETC